MADPDASEVASLAEVAVRVGVGLMPGQRLLIRSEVGALPLTRALTRAAYQAGAELVTTLFHDEGSSLIRYACAPDGSFGAFPGWLSRAQAEAIDEGTALLSIDSSDPELLASQDPDRVAEAARSAAAHQRPVLERISRFAVNWCIIAYPSQPWADRVFPDVPESERVRALWQAIARAVRLDHSDPVAAWTAHLSALAARCRDLGDRRYQALHFTGPGTDLRVGLVDGHRWQGGAATAGNGARCVPNLPTEEVFTMPHRSQVEGTVTATKPLGLRGRLVTGMRLRFEAGRVVHATADAGEAALHRFLDTDEGARYLGEVALVPHGSPISASNILFYNTLFDENAASHLALGSAYEDCIASGLTDDRADLQARGMNSSLVHEDWMVGSGQLAVDGILPSGTRQPLMRGGEWVA